MKVNDNEPTLNATERVNIYSPLFRFCVTKTLRIRFNCLVNTHRYTLISTKPQIIPETCINNVVKQHLLPFPIHTHIQKQTYKFQRECKKILQPSI